VREHDCRFEEVLVENDDGPLKKGMRVLIPCTCGETPLDHVSLLEGYYNEAQRAITQMEPWRPLYHWSPASRRKQILRYGLRPNMRSTITLGEAAKYKAPYICFADTPGWAWGLSGDMHWAPSGVWDLWQTSLDRLTKPTILPADDRSSGIYEVREEARVYKKDIWYVGSREKR